MPRPQLSLIDLANDTKKPVQFLYYSTVPDADHKKNLGSITVAVMNYLTPNVAATEELTAHLFTPQIYPREKVLVITMPKALAAILYGVPDLTIYAYAVTSNYKLMIQEFDRKTTSVRIDAGPNQGTIFIHAAVTFGTEDVRLPSPTHHPPTLHNTRRKSHYASLTAAHHTSRLASQPQVRSQLASHLASYGCRLTAFRQLFDSETGVALPKHRIEFDRLQSYDKYRLGKPFTILRLPDGNELTIKFVKEFYTSQDLHPDCVKVFTGPPRVFHLLCPCGGDTSAPPRGIPSAARARARAEAMRRILKRQRDGAAQEGEE